MPNKRQVCIEQDPNFTFDAKNKYSETVQRAYCNWVYTAKKHKSKNLYAEQCFQINKYGSKFDPDFKPNSVYPAKIQAMYHDMAIREYMEGRTINGKILNTIFFTTKVVCKVIFFPVVLLKVIFDAVYDN